MDLLVIEKHDGYGDFPLFPKGTAVRYLNACESYPHWCACVIDGRETFVPEVYVADGVLTRDYNPTELIVAENEIVTLVHIVYEWLYVRDANRRDGWLPASKVVSKSIDC